MIRRTLLAGSAALALAACATTTGGGGSIFAVAQSDVALVVAAYDRLVPLVPALAQYQADVDAAGAAVAAASGPSAGASAAQTLVQLVTTGLGIALPIVGAGTPAGLAIVAAQVLLPIIASAFGVSSGAKALLARAPAMSPDDARSTLRAFVG